MGLREVAVSAEDIVADLRDLGVAPGDHLGLGISLKSLGPVTGGPDALIDAILEAVGESGTILIPTYTAAHRLSEVRSGKDTILFDPGSTPSYTGIVGEKVRTRESAVRSRHPTNSMAAIGRLAVHFTEGHDETAPAYSPYSRLAAAGGKILSIGIGDRLVGIRHEAQHLAGLLDVVPKRMAVRYVDSRGEERLFVRTDPGGCVRVLPALVQDLRRLGHVKDGRVGAARATLSAARGVLEAMARMLTENPAINLCRMASCAWCRELERRLNLYDRIEDPRFFQNPVVGALMGIINRFRI